MSKKSPNYNQMYKCLFDAIEEINNLRNVKNRNPIDLAIDKYKKENSNELDTIIASNRIKRFCSRLLKDGFLEIHKTDKLQKSNEFNNFKKFKKPRVNSINLINEISEKYNVHIICYNTTKEVLRHLSLDLKKIAFKDPYNYCYIYRGKTLDSLAEKFDIEIKPEEKRDIKTNIKTSIFRPCIGSLYSVWKAPKQIYKEFITSSPSIAARLTISLFKDAAISEIDCPTFDIPGFLYDHSKNITLSDLKEYYQSFPCYSNTFSIEALNKVHSVLFSVGNTKEMNISEEFAKFEMNAVSWVNTACSELDLNENLYTYPEVLGRFYDPINFKPIGQFNPMSIIKNAKTISDKLSNFYYRILGLNQAHCAIVAKNHARGKIEGLGVTIICLHKNKLKSIASALKNNNPQFVNRIYMPLFLIEDLWNILQI